MFDNWAILTVEGCYEKILLVETFMSLKKGESNEKVYSVWNDSGFKILPELRSSDA